MKGISAVIGALIVLIITVALGGLAYTFITGTAGRRIATVLEVDASTTRCVVTTITVGVKNSGTDALPWNTITVSGTNSQGTAIAAQTCTNAGNLAAGDAAACTTTTAITGTRGTNKISVTSGISSASGVANCVG